jgi:hypothetical protein
LSSYKVIMEEHLVWGLPVNRKCKQCVFLYIGLYPNSLIQRHVGEYNDAFRNIKALYGFRIGDNQRISHVEKPA